MQKSFRNWSDARIFLAVARAGSTRQAGEELGMVQTTVSRRIEALEGEVGFELFDRDTRGFRLTSDGEKLVAPAEQIEAAAVEFEKTTHSIRSRLSGKVRLTAPPATFGSFLANLFKEFSSAHPGIEIEHMVTNEMVDLFAGEVDVAVRFTDKLLDERLVAQKLVFVSWTMFASRQYAETNGLPSPDQIKDHPVIGLRGLKRQWMTDLVKDIRFLIQCDSVNSMQVTIRNGIGIGPLPASIGDGDPELCRCFDPPEGMGDTGWVVTTPAARKRPEVRKFTSFFAPRLRKHYAEIEKAIHARNEKPAEPMN